MAPKLLILGGATEGAALSRRLAEAGVEGVVSLAGRVKNPAPLPLPRRIGGFGGVEGLADYLHAERITHLVDATHPFAAQMSAHAVTASAAAGVPLIALTRPPWGEQEGDRWTRVPDITAAVAALSSARRRVMLATGRMHLAEFAANPQHFYLLRLVDEPENPPPFPDHHIIVDRGPFTEAGDRALMEEHRIDLVVSKNAGGGGAAAKIAAARALRLPVLMIDRPHIPPRREAHDVEEVMDWLAHTPTDLGV